MKLRKLLKRRRRKMATIRTKISAFDTQVGGGHYKDYNIQPMEFFIANNINYPVAAVIKYVMRYKDKNGIQDLDKAIHILEMLKEDYGKLDKNTLTVHGNFNPGGYSINDLVKDYNGAHRPDCKEHRCEGECKEQAEKKSRFPIHNPQT
jgi:hypothetical protein